jgi:hypothetical protein
VTAESSARRADRADRAVRRSPALAWAVRGGLVGYGVLHLLIGFVAVRLVLTSDAGQATGRGALAQLAGEASGRVALAIMAVGFAAMVAWQVIAAAVGYRNLDGWTRGLQRFGAGCRAVVSGYLAVTAAELASLGSSAGSGSPGSTTASVMSWPAGAWIVALAGAVVAAVGVGLAVFGWRAGFLDQLDQQARSIDGRRVPIVVLGRVGYVAKGVALVVLGLLLVWAARTHDPQKSGGLDEALHELLGDTPGKVAIIVVASGLGCFGLFLLARARHLNREALTS